MSYIALLFSFRSKIYILFNYVPILFSYPFFLGGGGGVHLGMGCILIRLSRMLTSLK